MEEYKRGDIVVCRWGWNDVLQKPYEFLFDFGWYSPFGCMVLVHGESGLQSSYAFKMKQVRKATEEDLNNLTWGD